jgi:hypothetical protein
MITSHGEFSSFTAFAFPNSPPELEQCPYGFT